MLRVSKTALCIYRIHDINATLIDKQTNMSMRQKELEMKYFVIALVIVIGLAILNHAGVVHTHIFDAIIGTAYDTAASIH